MTDADGVIVRLESRYQGHTEYERRGIAIGSCWDERIAGTNGVAMAMAQNQAFTVRGSEHYFSKLAPFACTAKPLLDAENRVIGAVNLASIDRGNAAEYLFAKELLTLTSDRIQHMLFEHQFKEAMIVSVARPDERSLFGNNELLALDEAGLILGSDSPCPCAGRRAGPRCLDRQILRGALSDRHKAFATDPRTGGQHAI